MNWDGPGRPVTPRYEYHSAQFHPKLARMLALCAAHDIRIWSGLAFFGYQQHKFPDDLSG